MIDKTIRYETKVFELTDRYEAFLRKVLSYYEIVILKVLNIIKVVYYFSLTSLAKLGKAIRYSTFPLHWIWIKLHFKKYKDEEKLEDKPIFKVGAHYFYGLPKSGKSTIVFNAMMDYAYHTGKTSYTTARMELPRKNIYGEEYFLHQPFHPSEFYQDGEQIVQFNTQRHNVIVYEETLAQGMHQRNNNKKDYNDVVLPMISSMGTQRHQSIDLFYFISQLPRGDISLMHMLAGYHEVKIKKSFDYKRWLKTGEFRLRIKGWNVVSYDILAVSGHDYKKTNKKKWFYSCNHYEEFKYFNMLNMKEHYGKLPIHKGVEIT